MFKKALIVMIVAEGMSFLTFNFPVLSLPLLVAAGFATLYFFWRRSEWGIYILFGELFFGSRGHLLEYDLGFISISLRLVIFAAVLIVWMLSVILNGMKNPSEIKRSFALLRDDKFARIYLLLLLVIGFGIANGYLRGNDIANIFNDVNGYLFLLILPAVISVIKTRAQIEKILQILGAAVVVIAMKTLLLFLWFSFDWPGVADLYRWIITQDFGEITGNVGSASRIFMQSQFWALVGLFVFGINRTLKPSPSSGEGGPVLRLGEGAKWTIISSALLSLIMSLSRSFWLGAVAGGLFALIMIFWRFRTNFKVFLALGLKLGLIAVMEIAILYGIIALSGGGVAEAVSSRSANPASEAAGSARLLLLPELMTEIKQSPVLGSGFGTLITYKSYLPDRVTDANPEGEITNFAFEWGYLDNMSKIGFVGLLVYLFFIANIFKLAWKNLLLTTYNSSTLGFLSALIALLTLNVTTPYLNHPLGISYLIYVYSYLLVIRRENAAAR